MVGNSGGYTTLCPANIAIFLCNVGIGPFVYYPHQQMHNVYLLILLLLILQSFDWLGAFHLELLQAILFIAV